MSAAAVVPKVLWSSRDRGVVADSQEEHDD